MNPDFEWVFSAETIFTKRDFHLSQEMSIAWDGLI